MSRLLDMALDNMDTMEKRSFQPMPAGDPAAAGGDPAMAGDPAAMAPPMDPAMDPAMAGQAPMAAGPDPAVSSPPPATANVPPAASPTEIPPEIKDALVSTVRQVMQEMGVGAGGGAPAEGGADGKPAKDQEARLGAIEGALAQVLETMGLADPQQAVSQAVTDQAPAAGMSAGSGAPADGADAVPMPAMGPMSPGAPGALSEVDAPGGMQVAAHEAPLDRSTNAANVANAIQTLRARKGL